ncbi:MAG: hypothetical protein A2138_18865 [Deltaproteobacteria bacterium RBG_16_71_12]|nr:MAG: hypothetical protein A2138_18865 [Deltaproteobacteria bacterium RBG_16_71_12]
MAGLSVAGSLSSSAGNITCAVMMLATPACTAARNGTSSTASSRSMSCGRRGSAWWLSTSVSPWPGKCLALHATPAPCMPSMKRAPSLATTPASRAKLRSPITGFCGFVSTSTTGAKSQ